MFRIALPLFVTGVIGGGRQGREPKRQGKGLGNV
jgi:hypothetical protein